MTTTRKIAVVGCGAMGSIYAALLADDGHDVLCIDRNTAHIDAINRQGLRVSGASGDRTVDVRAFTEPPDEPVDLLVLAVKAMHVESAVAATSMVRDDGVVLTIQNGLGSAEVVARHCDPSRLLVGVAQGFGAELVAPGHSHHNDMKAIRIGAFEAGHAFLAEVAACFASAGFDTEQSDDILAVQWEKLICNVAYSGPCALSGMTVGDVMEDEYLGEVSRSAAVEAFTVARALGINIRVDDPVQYVQTFASRMMAAKPSVLLDIEAGRPSEIGVINGAVSAQAHKAGLTAPVNETITSLVLSLEQKLLRDNTVSEGKT